MENKPIIICGPSASGKSTIAKIISEQTGYEIYSVRDHYNNYLVPRYIFEHNFSQKEITRELHHKIADWVYAEIPDAYAKTFLSDIKPCDEGIFESFRLQGDLEHLHIKYPNALFIHAYAELDVRVKRKANSHDKLYSNTKNVQDIRNLLKYEWEHYKLQESMKYLLSIGAVLIDTSEFSFNDVRLHDFILQIINK